MGICSVVDSVTFSILAAIESSDRMGVIQFIIECGGDTDTTTSMFGIIFGAIHGSENLPLEIVKQIDAYELITETAFEFANLAKSD